MRVFHVPIAHLGTVDSARGPDAGPITFLVRNRAAWRCGVYRGGGGGGTVGTRGSAGVEHIGTHRDALIGARELLQLTDGDAGRSQGVKTGTHVARMALGQTAFDL